MLENKSINVERFKLVLVEKVDMFLFFKVMYFLMEKIDLKFY